VLGCKLRERAGDADEQDSRACLALENCARRACELSCSRTSTVVATQQFHCRTLAVNGVQAKHLSCINFDGRRRMCLLQNQRPHDDEGLDFPTRTLAQPSRSNIRKLPHCRRRYLNMVSYFCTCVHAVFTFEWVTRCRGSGLQGKIKTIYIHIYIYIYIHIHKDNFLACNSYIYIKYI
jgi:hypothetical protein